MRNNPRQAVKIDSHALALLVENMNGLTASDTQRLARKAIFDDGALQASDVPAMMRAKYDLLNHNGILRYEHDTAAFAVESIRRWWWSMGHQVLSEGKTSAVLRPHVRRRDGVRSTQGVNGLVLWSDVVLARVSANQACDAGARCCSSGRIRGGPMTGAARQAR